MDSQISTYRLVTKSGSLDIKQAAQALNKVIIVGHPQSGYAEIEQILLNSGMNPSLPALREKLSAAQITRQLCSAHGIPGVEALYGGEVDEIRQLEINPIWHALVLDLVRGNLDQEFWGWADPSAIFLLDFWKSVFPDVTFVMVYNHPRTALMNSQARLEEAHSEAPSPGDLLENWRIYNEALLTFYNQNPELCLLVHAEQLRKSPSRMLTQMKAISGNTVAPLSADENSEERENDDNPFDTTAVTVNYSESQASFSLSLVARQKNQDSLMPFDEDCATNPLEMYLANALLNHYPTVEGLYEKLQETALITFREKTNPENGINIVWNTFQEMMTANHKLTNESLELEQRMDDFRRKLEYARRQIDEKQIELGRIYQQNRQLEKELESRKSELSQLQNEKLLPLNREEQQGIEQKLRQENELLLNQLNLIQEQLEEYFVENKNNESLLPAEANRYEDMDSLLMQKSRELKQSRPLKKEFESRKSEEINQLQNEKLLPLNREEQREIEQKLRQENELLLKQLNLVQEELEKYFVENKNNESLMSAGANKNGDMESFLQNSKKLQTEIKTHRANPKPVFTGAKQRQQNDPIYRIGDMFLQMGRSFIKWKLLFYPLFINSFLKNDVCNSHQSEQWLPPVTEYEDYEEAVKAKMHLSYQLGLTWKKNYRKFGAYFIMPWAMLGTTRRWKRERKKQKKAA